jgi:hypothetical protein
MFFETFAKPYKICCNLFACLKDIIKFFYIERLHKILTLVGCFLGYNDIGFEILNKYDVFPWLHSPA